MTKQEKQQVHDLIEAQGFEYGLLEYSAMEEVRDEEFHALLEAYRAARQELSDYIGEPDTNEEE